MLLGRHERKWGLRAAIWMSILVCQLSRAEFGERDPNAPTWPLDPEFSKDVFTFVRIEYDSYRTWYGWPKWQIDYPDAEINLSYRLQQITSLKVNPNPITMRLTDPHLHEYPFIYIVEPGQMILKDSEVVALRKYLLNGGFLMIDDFWGEDEYENLHRELKRVFPDREPQDLPPEHPIFNMVFKLNKNELQIPNYGLGTESVTPGHPNFGITWERPDAREVHFRSLFDDKGRMMVLICHNTDNGDGWEREGENPLFFEHFSMKKGYPLTINIILYIMTH